MPPIILLNNNDDRSRQPINLDPDTLIRSGGPGLLEAVRLYLLVLLLLVLISLFLTGLNLKLVMAVNQWLIILLPALIFLRYYRVDRLNYLRLQPLAVKSVPVIVLLSFSFWLLNMALASVLITFLIDLGYQPEILIPPPENWSQYLLYLLLIVFSAGVCEEVLFRGAIMPAIEKHGLLPAIIYSSLLFALFHGSFIRLFSTFILGMVIAVIVVKTGSLLGGVLFHMLNNFYAVTFMYLTADFNSTLAEEMPVVWISVLLLLIPGLIGAYWGFRILNSQTGFLPILKQKAGLLPAGWFNLAFCAGLFIFLILALFELSAGFGWLGL